MAGRLTMAMARRALGELHPDRNVTVEPFDDDGGWELQFDLPFGPGRRRSEVISARDVATTEPAALLRQLDWVITREVGKSEEYGRQTGSAADYKADAMGYSTVRGVDRTPWPKEPPTRDDRLSGFRIPSSLQYDPFRISAMDYGVGTFGAIRREFLDAYAAEQSDSARIEAMSFEDYVAELHAGLDPRGAGL